MDNKGDLHVQLTTRTVLIFILSLQLALFGSIGFDHLGLSIPLLRQIIGLVYLTFVPGFLLLTILKPGEKPATETLLYSVGLSISFLMFIGALVNFLYPLLGIPNPISEIPLITTLGIITLALLPLFYLRCRNRSASYSIDLRKMFSPGLFALVLLPFLAVFSTYMLNSCNSNLLLVTFFIIASIVPILALKGDQQDYYPFIIWVLALSLCLSTSLTEIYPTQMSESAEYYFSNLTLAHGIWNPSIPFAKNSILGSAILFPIYSIIGDLSLTWIYNILPPVLVSIIPVALYSIFSSQFNAKIAFLSSCLFIFLPFSYVLLTVTPRSGIAILFFALLISSLSDGHLKGEARIILALAFSFGLITSHYGTSYTVLFFLLAVAVLSSLLPQFRNNPQNFLGSHTFILLFVVLTLAWYMYTSSSTGFEILPNFGRGLINSLDEFLSPESGRTLHLLTKHYESISLRITKYTYILVTLALGIGLLSEIRGKWLSRYPSSTSTSSYIVYSSIFAVVVSFGLLPTQRFGLSRIYPIALVVIAPFVIVGFRAVFRKIYVKAFCTFLVLIFLCNAGVLSATITKDLTFHVSTIRPYLREHGNVREKFRLFSQFRSEYDIFSSKWLIDKKGKNPIIYSSGPPACILDDLFSTGYYAESARDLRFSIPNASHIPLKENILKGKDEGYIYIGEFNIRTGLVNQQSGRIPGVSLHNFIEMSDFNLESMNRVYNNGYSRVYKIL